MMLELRAEQAVRKLKRAQILLAADAGSSDDEITCTVAVGGSTVYRTKRRFRGRQSGSALCPSEEPRPGAERKLTGKEEALCWWRIGLPRGLQRDAAPAGPWELLADRDGQALPNARSAPAGTRTVYVGGRPKTTSAPGARTCGAFPRSTAKYDARMGDVLDLYAEAVRSQATSGHLLRRKSGPFHRRGASTNPG